MIRYLSFALILRFSIASAAMISPASLAGGVSAVGADGRWPVFLEPFPKKFTQLLVIENDELRVRLTAQAAWTIYA